jgi:short-subunit dehydrogenase
MRHWVLITGASGGIGLEIARCFARDGYDLLLAARSLDKLRSLAADLKQKHGTETRCLESDLSQPGAAESLMARIGGEGLPVGFLVNNAGFGLHGECGDLSLEEQRGMVQLNCMALMELTRLCLPGMLERNFGRILNVASTAAFQPGPYMAVYYATKAFVLSFSEALNFELRQKAVSVTAFCPGLTSTGFQKRAGLRENWWSRLLSASAAEVAETGYRAMLDRRRVAIPGALNRAGSVAAKLFPRTPVLWAVAKVQKNRRSKP